MAGMPKYDANAERATAPYHRVSLGVVHPPSRGNWVKRDAWGNAGSPAPCTEAMAALLVAINSLEQRVKRLWRFPGTNL
jgi:hypothetical protein